MTMLEEVGGKDAIDELVDFFYARVLLDPALAPWFRQIDIKRLRRHQVEFFSALLGGDAYTGKDLRTAHHGMKITEEAFGRVGGYLSEALKKHNVPDHVHTFLMEKVVSVKHLIVESNA